MDTNQTMTRFHSTFGFWKLIKSASRSPDAFR
jgi:hypothetical protein